MSNKYQTQGKPIGQILDIKKLSHTKIKITGFAAESARTEVKEILDKASLMKFPPQWVDTHLLITGEKNLIIKDVT